MPWLKIGSTNYYAMHDLDLYIYTKINIKNPNLYQTLLGKPGKEQKIKQSILNCQHIEHRDDTSPPPPPLLNKQIECWMNSKGLRVKNGLFVIIIKNKVFRNCLSLLCEDNRLSFAFVHQGQKNNYRDFQGQDRRSWK